MKIDSIYKYLNEHLSDKRIKHTEGVRNAAIKLAEKYNIDVDKTELAAVCHDICKWLKGEELNSWVKRYKLDDVYLNNSNLAHSKLGAIFIQEKFNITDNDIINAVSFHTTGRPEMTTLEKIIYLADAIEPGRQYPGVEKLRQLAFNNLDEAMLFSLERTISYVESQGSHLDRDTLRARDYLKQKEKFMDNKEYALLAAKTTLDKKAEDVMVIDIMGKSSFADYLVIATGNSDRQVNALVDDVEDKLAENGLMIKNIEGKQSGWALMDFGDVVVNIFTKEMREKYNLEKVWGDCTTLDIEE